MTELMEAPVETKAKVAKLPQQIHILECVWTGAATRGYLYDAEVRMVTLDEKERLEPGSTAAFKTPQPIRENWMEDRDYDVLVAGWKQRQAMPGQLYPVKRCFGATALPRGFYVVRGVDAQYRRPLMPTTTGLGEAVKGLRWLNTDPLETLAEAKALAAEREQTA